MGVVAAGGTGGQGCPQVLGVGVVAAGGTGDQGCLQVLGVGVVAAGGAGGQGCPQVLGVGVVAAGGPGARCIAGARCRTCPAQAGCECMNHFHICNDLPLPSALLTTHH